MKTKVVKKINEVVVSKDSKGLDKSKHKLKKQAQKREEAREKAQDDATVDISLDATLASTSKPASRSSSVQPTPKAKSTTSEKKAAVQDISESDDSDDDNVEIDAQEHALIAKNKGKAANGIKAFEQRDLVALAFAGDNVVQVSSDSSFEGLVFNTFFPEFRRC